MKWPSPKYLSLVPRLQNIRNQSKACLFILARNLRNLRASENGCIRGNCDFLASPPYRTVLISQGPATSMYDCYVCSFSLSKEIWWWITSASEAWHFGNQRCESHKVGMAFEENEESRRQEIQGPGARHDGDVPPCKLCGKPWLQERQPDVSHNAPSTVLRWQMGLPYMVAAPSNSAVYSESFLPAIRTGREPPRLYGNSRAKNPRVGEQVDQWKGEIYVGLHLTAPLFAKGNNSGYIIRRVNTVFSPYGKCCAFVSHSFSTQHCFFARYTSPDFRRNPGLDLQP